MQSPHNGKAKYNDKGGETCLLLSMDMMKKIPNMLNHNTMT